MTWRACGDHAALWEADDLATVVRLHAALADELAAGQLVGVLDLVPAARTLMVRCRSKATLVRAVERISAVAAGPLPPVEHGGREVVVGVRYDGEDLDDVAELLAISRDEVVRRHTETRWRAAFTGFAPGFAYLVADDGSRPLEVPRRAEPRTSVPAGAVGLAGEFSGVYPRSSPGGWQLIGHTDVALWDLARDVPALVAPGDRVRFEAHR